MKARIATVAATLIVGFSANTAAAEVCKDPLTVGWGSYPPFQIVGENGPKGIDAEVLKAVGKRIGCEIEWKKRPFKRQLAEVKAGKLDAAAALVKTKKRSQYANWAGPYIPFNSNLWVASGDSKNYDSLKSFLSSGKTLGIVRGYQYPGKTQKLLKKEKYKDQIRKFSGDKTNIKMVAAGRVGGTLGNNFVLGYLAKQQGVADKVRKSSANVFGDPGYIMISKKAVSQETLNAVDKALEAMKNDGTIQKIVKKHTGTNVSF